MHVLHEGAACGQELFFHGRARACQFAHIDKAGRAMKGGPKLRDGTEARQAGETRG